eukprot:910393_1
MYEFAVNITMCTQTAPASIDTEELYNYVNHLHCVLQQATNLWQKRAKGICANIKRLKAARNKSKQTHANLKRRKAPIAIDTSSPKAEDANKKKKKKVQKERTQITKKLQKEGDEATNIEIEWEQRVFAWYSIEWTVAVSIDQQIM